jgi:integrase/recombinase XerD
MIKAIETYLAMRRTTGFTLSNAEYLLRSFASFTAHQKQTHIRTATVIRWAGQARSVAQRHVRYQTVCLLAQYLRVEDPRHESPPTNYFGYRKVRRVPHIYSCDEIERIVLAAKRLPWFNSLRSETYATLISLLAATGLRISEALHLLVSDIATDGLLIRKTKFQKTRLVPLHETAWAGLSRYLTHRQEMRGSPSLRTDRFAHRRCRSSVSQHLRARQGAPRTRAASLEDDGCGTPRLVGHSRSRRIARALRQRPRYTL